MRTAITTRILTILGSLFTVTPVLAQHKITYITVDYPTSYSYTAPLGINERGDVAGFYDDKSGAIHGYIRVKGKFTPIDFPNSTSTYCSSVSLNGDLSGTYFDQKGFQHGFRTQKGHFITIDVPGAVQTTGIEFELGTGLGTAEAVATEDGESVGEYADSRGAARAWVYFCGHFHTLNPPGQDLAAGLGSGALGINTYGEVVGGYYTAKAPYAHGFLYNEEGYTHIEAPESRGTFGTQANGINDQGEIVGAYGDATETLHGFLRRDSRYITVDIPGAILTECHVINNRGQITGLYVDTNQIAHGFIATVK